MNSLPQRSGAAATVGGDAHPFEHAERYEERSLLGEGGMGRVVLVHDRRLARDVALKTPRHGVDAARLAQEAWITAQLEHPGIVPVYDAGKTADGALFYTMRVIRGRSLEDELAATPDLAGRLRYVRHYLAACEAVAYAHEHGIVHRDLKPQNILVGGLGETQVCDWGVACPASSEVGRAWVGVIPQGHSVETIAGGVVGTPAYMSPEQSRGAAADPRADVWSLGAILRRLLSGDEPRELAAIAERALREAPAARYASARELAADVASWLDGRRVSAYSYSSWELLRRLAYAWRVPLAIVGVALIVLVVGAVLAVDRIVDARDRADATLARSLVAQAQRELLRGQMPEAEVLAAEALALVESPEARGISMATDVPRPTAERVVDLPNCAVRAVSPAGKYVICGRESLAGWALEPARLQWSLPIAARSVVFASDAVAAVADRQNRIHRIDVRVGRELHPPVAVHQASGLSASGQALLTHWGWVTASIDAQGHPTIRDACPESRAVRLVLALPDLSIDGCDDGAVHGSDGASFSMDSGALGTHAAVNATRTRLATVNERGRLTVVGWPDGTNVVDRMTGLRGPQAIAFHDDLLAVASRHGATEVLAARDGTRRWRFPREAALDAHWDGDRLVTRADDRVVTWRLPERAVASLIGDGDAGIAALAVHDRWIAVGRGSGTVDVHGLDGTKVRSLELGDQTVKSLAFTRAGDRLYIAVIGSASIRVFTTADWREQPGFGSGHYRRVAVLANGTVIALSWSAPPERFVDGVGARSAGRAAFDLDVAPDGGFAVMLDDDGAVLVSDGGEPRMIATVPGAIAVAVGEHIAVGGSSRLMLLGRDGHEFGNFALASPALDIAFARDHLVVGEAEGARVYDREGHTVALLRAHEERVAQVAVTDDAIYTASWDGAIRRWGLDALTASAETLRARAHETWRLDLPRALGASE